MRYLEKIVYFFLKYIFRLIHKELTEEVFQAMMQFVKFAIVGLSNTVVSYVLYLVFFGIFNKLGVLKNTDYLVAQTVSFLLSVLWSFYWNNKMVFTLEEGKKRSVWLTLLKTYASYSFTGLFLNNILLILWIQYFHISELIAPICNLIISVPLNFLMNKFWAYKSR